MEDCLFCKIVASDIPSYKIYEDNDFLAFLDIFPATEGYTLVIPKKHYRWVWDVENIGAYFEVCQKVAKHFQKVTNNESVYSMTLGEEVPHAHVRIFSGSDKDYSAKLANFVRNNKSQNPIDKSDAQKVIEKFKLPAKD